MSEPAEQSDANGMDDILEQSDLSEENESADTSPDSGFITKCNLTNYDEI